MKLLVCCGNGAGTSLMIKMNVEKILKKLDVQVDKIYHCAISEGKSAASNYDIVLCSKNFESMFKDAIEKGVKVIGLKNIMSVDEIEKGLRETNIF